MTRIWDQSSEKAVHDEHGSLDPMHSFGKQCEMIYMSHGRMKMKA